MSDEAETRPICAAKAIVDSRGFHYMPHVLPTIFECRLVPVVWLPETYLRLLEPMSVSPVARGVSMIRRQDQVRSPC
jgi:hypothetical protein